MFKCTVAVKYESQFPYSGPLFVQFRIYFSLIRFDFVTKMCLFQNTKFNEKTFLNLSDVFTKVPSLHFDDLRIPLLNET